MTLKLEGGTRIVAGETHIAEINLELEPGSLNLLLGPTLSGKTSLMRLMAGLDRPSEGRVLVDGRDVTGNSVRKRDVALRTVHGVQDRVAQEDARRPEPDPRKRHPARVVHGTGAQAGRPDRVLPLAGARRLDADRHQRAGRPEAGAALVAEHRRGGRGRGHRRYRHGQPGPPAGPGDGAHRA
ncbi:MAG: ATP-binding cassette domain-containing protein [Proteobacteria bacterium]|nr:ATP-binding cassette domain-containing protein [Pseudomonadota bacterium]